MSREIRLLGKYDREAVTLRSAVDTRRSKMPPLVQQHLTEEADINTIVRRFGITGQRPAGLAGGVFGDFTGIFDYDTAKAAVERADKGFLALPAEVRERFYNDPGRLVEFAQNVPEEMLNAELGLAVPGVPAAPVAPVAPVAPASD